MSMQTNWSFVRANSKTINTSTVGGSSTTLTSAGHGFKTGDKILYTAAGTAMSGSSGGTFILQSCRC